MSQSPTKSGLKYENIDKYRIDMYLAPSQRVSRESHLKSFEEVDASIVTLLFNISTVWI